MKRILCILIASLFVITNAYSQTDNYSNSIRMLAKEHMIANRELSPTAKTEEPNSIMLTVFDVKNKIRIKDISTPIPVSDTLLHYRILTFGPHTYVHLMFVKNGKYTIINMRQTLPEIMSQCVNMCDELMLDYEDSIYIFKEALNYYERNDSNRGGPRITILKEFMDKNIAL